MLRRYVKVDKVEETRAEAAAKAAAAEKLLTQENAGAEAGSAAMETETSEAAETPAAAAPSEEAAVGMEVEDAAEAGDAAAAVDEKEPAELVKELTAFEDPEMPENKTGWYELVAILTHKGQNADGGHYVAWVQHKGDTWVCFDDDKVTECRYASSASPSRTISARAQTVTLYSVLFALAPRMTCVSYTTARHCTRSDFRFCCGVVSASI